MGGHGASAPGHARVHGGLRAEARPVPSRAAELCGCPNEEGGRLGSVRWDPGARDLELRIQPFRPCSKERGPVPTLGSAECEAETCTKDMTRSIIYRAKK